MNHAAIAGAVVAVRVLQQSDVTDGVEMWLTLRRVAEVLRQPTPAEVGFLRSLLLREAAAYLDAVARELQLAGNDVRGYVGLPSLEFPPSPKETR